MYCFGPYADDVATVRFGQTANLSYVPNAKMKNTFMAVTTDLGDAWSPWDDYNGSLLYW